MAKKDRAHSNELPDVSFISNPEVRHEESDVRIKPILWFGFWLAVSTVAIYFMLWGLFRFFERREAKTDTPPPPLASERQPLPPEPRLQLAPSEVGQKIPDLREHPLAELKELRQDEEKWLTNYGVDPATGAIRIPIKRAKQLVLERNLLQSAQPPARQAGGDLRQPSDTSSGRATERRPQ